MFLKIIYIIHVVESLKFVLIKESDLIDARAAAAKVSADVEREVLAKAMERDSSGLEEEPPLDASAEDTTVVRGGPHAAVDADSPCAPRPRSARPPRATRGPTT